MGESYAQSAIMRVSVRNGKGTLQRRLNHNGQREVNRVGLTGSDEYIRLRLSPIGQYKVK